MSRKMIKLFVRMFKKYPYATVNNDYSATSYTDRYDNWIDENRRRLIRHVNDGNLHRTLARMAD